MRDGLIQAGHIDGTLLDIGAGVGALTFELLEAGATRVVAVDASPAYIATAAREAARRNCLEAYPRDVWHVRIWNAIVNGKRRLSGSPFRTYIHSASHMAQLVTAAGFRLVSRRGTWVWSVDVYARSTSPSK